MMATGSGGWFPLLCGDKPPAVPLLRGDRRCAGTKCTAVAMD